MSAPAARNGKNGFLFGYNETAESARNSEPERLLLVFRYEVRHAQPDEAEGVFALRRDASGQRLRGTQQGATVGQHRRISQRTGDDAEIVGFEFQGYAFGFDVFTLYLPPQIFGQMRQVSGGLRER